MGRLKAEYDANPITNQTKFYKNIGKITVDVNRQSSVKIRANPCLNLTVIFKSNFLRLTFRNIHGDGQSALRSFLKPVVHR